VDAIFKVLYATEEDFVAVGAEDEGGAPAGGGSGGGGAVNASADE
jgi:hypothetical protein